MQLTGSGIAFSTFDEDQISYSALLASIDPKQPVALHVPRWKGVTSFTLNLFQQRLPIPLLPSSPPELVNEDDVARYARMLLSTGASHFIVSGGDIFFIRIIRAVHRLAPEIRFDLLWHSNYIQMSEAGDWSTLKQWLALHAAGELTRIGVVKHGLDIFLREAGVDSVFIPNIVQIEGFNYDTNITDASVVFGYQDRAIIANCPTHLS